MTKTREAPDVVVIGGGIVGLTVAWRLAQEGAAVTVLERERVGSGATGASAGMLAPLSEAKKPGPFLQLGLESLRLYPAYIAGLIEESAMDPGYQSPGLLRVALDEGEAAGLSDASEWQRAAGLPVHALTGEEARRLEPVLSPGTAAALLSPDEKQYDPRILVRALAEACSRRGVKVLEFEQAAGFERSGTRVLAVKTTTGSIPCGQTLISVGAWSPELGSALGARLPITPVRGQIVALRCTPLPFHHTIYAHISYLVPRAGGRVLCGTTAEAAGFDTRPTAGGIASILERAVALAPALRDAPFDDAWAGLRPATPDALPILGPLPGFDNAYAATGHFRNGILLAPITGRLMAELLLRGETPPLLRPFSPERFSNV